MAGAGAVVARVAAGMARGMTKAKPSPASIRAVRFREAANEANTNIAVSNIVQNQGQSGVEPTDVQQLRGDIQRIAQTMALQQEAKTATYKLTQEEIEQRKQASRDRRAAEQQNTSNWQRYMQQERKTQDRQTLTDRMQGARDKAAAGLKKAQGFGQIVINSGARQFKEDPLVNFFLLGVVALFLLDVFPLSNPYVGYNLIITDASLLGISKIFLSVAGMGFVIPLLIIFFFRSLVFEHRLRMTFLLLPIVLAQIAGASVFSSFSSLINSPNFYLLILFAVGAYFASPKRSFQTVASDDIAFIILVFAYSFVLGTVTFSSDWRSAAHFAYIVLFSVAIISKYEKMEANEDSSQSFNLSDDRSAIQRQASSSAYIWSAGILLFDFFGYTVLKTFSPLVKVIPFLFLAVISYTARKTQSKWAGRSSIFIMGVMAILLFSYSGNAIGKDGTITASLDKTSEDAKGRLALLWDSFMKGYQGRIQYATQFQGQVEQNKYESLGVYFLNVRAAQPKFYTQEPVIIWGTIRSKTFGDMAIVNLKCLRKKDGKTLEAGQAIPNIPFPIFQYEETDVECKYNKSTFDPGTQTVTLAAEFNFTTTAYQKAYFMERERYRTYARESIDPLTQFGIKDKNPATVYTNGPVEIGMKVTPLMTVSNVVSTDEGGVSPFVYLTVSNKQQVEDKDKKIISKWEGKIKNIRELVLLTPPGVSLQESKEYPERFDCSPIPFKAYTIEDCKSACTQAQFAVCSSVCKESAFCKSECEVSKNRCVEDCSIMFQESLPDANPSQFTAPYNAYALDLTHVNYVKTDEYKDIGRYQTFGCRLKTSADVLDNSPITTRYFRVIARYNYLLENNVPVIIEASPYKPDDKAREPIYALSSQFENKNILTAVATVESGLKHCCRDSGKTSFRECTPTDELSCPADRILNSGSSVGIMQINKINEGLASTACASGQNIYHKECNIRIGMKILSDSYKKWGTTGIPPTLVDKYCKDSTLAAKYKGYRGWDAALRAYNGLGCSIGADTDYVEKVNKAIQKVNEGIIVSEDINTFYGARLGSGMQQGEWIETPASSDMSSPDMQGYSSASQPNPPRSLVATQSQNKAIITFEPSTSAGVNSYRITRQKIGTENYAVICDQTAISGKTSYQCDDNAIESKTTYSYRAYAYGGAGNTPSEYSSFSFTTTEFAQI